MSCACVTIRPAAAWMPNSACTSFLIPEEISACSSIALNRGMEEASGQGSNPPVHSVNLADGHADRHGLVTSLPRLPGQPPPHLLPVFHKEEDLHELLHLKKCCQHSWRNRNIIIPNACLLPT